MEEKLGMLAYACNPSARRQKQGDPWNFFFFILKDSDWQLGSGGVHLSFQR